MEMPSALHPSGEDGGPTPEDRLAQITVQVATSRPHLNLIMVLLLNYTALQVDGAFTSKTTSQDRLPECFPRTKMSHQ